MTSRTGTQMNGRDILCSPRNTVSHPMLAAAVCVLTMASAVSNTHAQLLRDLGIRTDSGLTVHSTMMKVGRDAILPNDLPLISLLINDSLVSFCDAKTARQGDSIVYMLRKGILGSLKMERDLGHGWKGNLALVNGSPDTIIIANVVPFGEGPGRVYITATGSTAWPNYLSRSALFRPGLGPIGVVLPDDAWEMGFCDISIGDDYSLVGIARRVGSDGGDERRFRTILPPGALVRYVLYADAHAGEWQQGLRVMFQQRWLYDLTTFDNRLFERRDLLWIRHSYLLTILFAWDHRYTDAIAGAPRLENFLLDHQRQFGQYDAFILWPTWPRLGIDQRNQFDLYRDLPGALPRLRREAGIAHRMGTKYFISYNPWDTGTRRENHLEGIRSLLSSIDADGIVLDTWGSSTREVQAAADSVRPGIIMYSEGMAVPADMPGIVAGRVHDALYMPPPLNLNKFIKPEFAIFRVLQVAEGRLHREAAVCLFNGYGMELNVMRAGTPPWMDAEYAYMGKIVKVLRDNSSAFVSSRWTPLIPAAVDSMWVNRWPTAEKVVYTVYGLRPEGYQGPLFEAPDSSGRHYVSIWHHEEIVPVTVGERTFIPATVEGFSRAWLGTRREANVDCIAWLPELLRVRLDPDTLYVSVPSGDSIVVTAGDPSYESRSITLPAQTTAIPLQSRFGPYEGKFVVQVFGGGELRDERVVTMRPATPRLVSVVKTTPRASRAPEGMTEIPAGSYSFVMTSTDVPNPIIPYPDFTKPTVVSMPRFFIDTYPVTNAGFRQFLRSAHYAPKDRTNFLKHWVHGKLPRGEENYPVVWVSLDDARAYARWAGKRLPTNIEWQYAAQGTDGRIYPWGSAFDSSKCNTSLAHLTAVDAFPSGKSPYGVMDLVGNVWQMMSDVYDNGSEYFGILRGGSYYNPSGSEWYVRGGPWRIDQHQMLLMVGPGLDRNATVGFRCVKDAQE